MNMPGNPNQHSSRRRIIRATLIGLLVGSFFATISLYSGGDWGEAYSAWMFPNVILACLSASTTGAIIATSGKKQIRGLVGAATGAGLGTAAVLVGLGLEGLQRGYLLSAGLRGLLALPVTAAVLILPCLAFGGLFGWIFCFAGDAVDIIITEARPNNPVSSTVARTIGVACAGVLGTFPLWAIVFTAFIGRL